MKIHNIHIGNLKNIGYHDELIFVIIVSKTNFFKILSSCPEDYYTVVCTLTGWITYINSGNKLFIT